MTKSELIAQIRAKQESAKDAAKPAVNAKDASAEDNFSLENIDKKVVDDVPAATGMPDDVLPTQAEIEKKVDDAIPPVIPADEDGISTNGGPDNALMEPGGIEKEKAKAVAASKDVINVTDRHYSEQTEVQAELLKKLEESAAVIEKQKADIANINLICKEALAAQKSQYTKFSAEKTAALIESIITLGEAMETELTTEAATAKKNLAKVESTLRASNKLNRILHKSLTESRAEKKMVRYESTNKKLLKVKA